MAFDIYACFIIGQSNRNVTVTPEDVHILMGYKLQNRLQQ
jgi:hypothetical protein